MPAVKKSAVKKVAAPKKVKKAAVVAETVVEKPAKVRKAPAVRAPKADTAIDTAQAATDLVYVVIDHPITGETMISNHYAIRLGASWGGVVELMIDDSEWMTCRHNSGYWWFDWHNIPAGAHKLVARLVDNNGTVLKKSTIRKVTAV
jgi:hypothetical protein